jgi:hypothetical protein
MMQNLTKSKQLFPTNTITCYGSQNGWEFQNAGFEEIEDTEPLILYKVF